MKRPLIQKTFLLTFVVILGLPVYAQLKTKRVAVFKNNRGFFLKSGQVGLVDGVYTLEGEIPRALNGTLWFQSPDNSIRSVVSKELVQEKKVVPSGIYEILRASLNQTVTVYISPNETIKGVVFSFSREFDEASGTWFPAAMVTLQDGLNWHTVKIEDIKRVTMQKANPGDFISHVKKKAILLNFQEQKTKQALNTMYLSDGISWNPTYLLELVNETKGVLTLNGEIKNDAEDIQEADMSFVAGNANFNNSGKLDWLVDFLPPVDYSVEPGTYSNSTYSFKEAAAAPPPAESGAEGESAGDLFFYTLKNISLPKASRGQYELFRTDVAIQHIYNARIGGLDAWSLENYAQPAIGSEERTIKTYHSVKMTNASKYPWTSGLCFVTDNEKQVSRPVSQDVLEYTPIKGETFLKLNETPDIKIEHVEKEISRNNTFRKVKDVIYDQLTIEGEIKVKNYRENDVQLQVNRLLVGEILKSTADYTTTEKINYTTGLNKTGDVAWKVRVKAGEELTIKYSYRLIVRAN